MSMNGIRIESAPGGRKVVKRDNGPDEIATPLAVARNAITDTERDVLLRFIDASEMSKGNMAVSLLGGEPRGRYAKFADKVTHREYLAFEIEAYRWILGRAFGRESMTLAEVFARMCGDRMEITVEQLGTNLSNIEGNTDVSLGAVIGAVRSLAWALMDAYRDHAEFWKIRKEAADRGLPMSETDATRRLRRNDTVRQAFMRQPQPLIDKSGES